MLTTYHRDHGELVRTLPASADRQGKSKEMKQQRRKQNGFWLKVS